MKTNVFSQNENENNISKVVAVIGRWMPIHNGHKHFLIDLASKFDKLIIMIGSCYEGGKPRYCITATEREKMLRAIFKRENIAEEKLEFVPVPDVPTFEEWIENVQRVCEKFHVTHFCTGNREDILNVLESKGQTLGMEFINPEENSNFPYHATDIREMIIRGNYEELEHLIPNEIKPILFRYTFKEILAASQKRGIHFIEGRQTVDIILLVKNIEDGKIYVLLGKRPKDKEDFPNALALPGGGIQLFESSINAATRVLKEETGIDIKIIDNSLEPAIVRFNNSKANALEQMYMVGIYGTENQVINGTMGGSSECFAVLIEGDLKNYQKMVIPNTEGLTDVRFHDIQKLSKKKLAYQHSDMLKKAINMLEAYPNLQHAIQRVEKIRDTLVISFVGASGTGKSTAALGTAYELKKKGCSVEYVDEVAKNLLYNGLLERYILNQTYLIAEQYKKIYDLLGRVDYIISDAGLQISALHASQESAIENLAWYLTKKINQVTILIERDTEKVKFEQDNRLEDEEESKKFGEKLEEYLKIHKANYIKVKGAEAAVEKALEIIEKIKEGQNINAEN